MASPSPRRRFQFRLRTLLIGVTLLAPICGYLGRQWERNREEEAALQLVEKTQAAALQLIEKLGGNYTIDSTPMEIELPPESTLADRRRIAAALPDARVWIWQVPIVRIGSVREGDKILFIDNESRELGLPEDRPPHFSPTTRNRTALLRRFSSV